MLNFIDVQMKKKEMKKKKKEMKSWPRESETTTVGVRTARTEAGI